MPLLCVGDDFPQTNWNLKRWLWLPALRFFGLFKMTFFRHVLVLSGVGVGGGSLVYANTLPVPKEKQLPNMTVLSVAPLLAEVILRAHAGRSVGELFDE